MRASCGCHLCGERPCLLYLKPRFLSEPLIQRTTRVSQNLYYNATQQERHGNKVAQRRYKQSTTKCTSNEKVTQAARPGLQRSAIRTHHGTRGKATTTTHAKDYEYKQQLEQLKRDEVNNTELGTPIKARPLRTNRPTTCAQADDNKESVNRRTDKPRTCVTRTKSL